MNEIMRYEETAPLTPAQVRQQINLIQQIMKEAMQENEHYGKIPGCGDKPTLLKAGAEKLILTFRFDVQPEIEVIDLDGGHREYRCKCTVYSQQGNRLGAGVGTCSTMESKYRYRCENTGKTVPKEYWDNNRDNKYLGGDSYVARKVDKQWLIFHRAEHDNPADYWNTCEKMAKKRSLVDSVLSVTAASDCFTQDIEEMDIAEQKTTEADEQQHDEIQKPKAKSELQPEKEKPKAETKSEPKLSPYGEMMMSFKKAKKVLGEKAYRDLLKPFKKANEIPTVEEGQKILDKMSDYLDTLEEVKK